MESSGFSYLCSFSSSIWSKVFGTVVYILSSNSLRVGTAASTSACREMHQSIEGEKKEEEEKSDSIEKL